MKKMYDRLSVFNILLVVSIAFNYIIQIGEERTAISYDTIFKYAVIIFFAIVIFEVVQSFPIKSPLFVYFIASMLIAAEAILFECMIWNWLNLTLTNVILLSLWVFIVCGIITVGFIKKNRADVNLMNRRLDEWRAACLDDMK